MCNRRRTLASTSASARTHCCTQSAALCFTTSSLSPSPPRIEQTLLISHTVAPCQAAKIVARPDRKRGALSPERQAAKAAAKDLLRTHGALGQQVFRQAAR